MQFRIRAMLSYFDEVKAFAVSYTYMRQVELSGIYRYIYIE